MIDIDLSYININTINEFLDLFEGINNFNLEKGTRLPFSINKNRDYYKIDPIFQLAKIKDAGKIASIIREVYEGTYPYKEMEHVSEIQNMIRNPNFSWILFKINKNEISGIGAAHLELEQKKGNFFAFVMSKKYQKKINIMKIVMGHLFIFMKKYKNQILLWHCETRTAHATAQWTQSLCGFRPLALFPNKDRIFGQLESEFFQVIYDKKALRDHRCKNNPQIIPEVNDCFQYSDGIYDLGTVDFVEANMKYNTTKILEMRKNFCKEVKDTSDWYKTILFRLKNSNAYFEFSYSLYNQIIEKIKYEIEEWEELHVFVQELIRLVKNSEIRYFECFVSAYEPIHQRIFINAGCSSSGYIPSWRYNPFNNTFEDHIVFCYYEGEIDLKNRIELIPETARFLLFPKMAKYLSLK